MELSASIFDRFSPTKRALGIIELIDKVAAYLKKDDVQMVRDAFNFGAHAHEGQTRSSGEAYISHPVAVASILADMNFDVETLVAAILHDTIEDTPVEFQQIRDKFGEDVANLVEGVTKLDKLKFRTREEAQAESFRKLMLAMTDDIRVILIKLADRLHNMRTLGALKPEKKRRIARETLDIYAPIAHRLGLNQFKRELQDLSLQAIYPDRYRVIESAIKETRGDQIQLMRRMKKRIKTALDEQKIEAVIDGRKKETYSIYKKMLKRARAQDDLVTPEDGLEKSFTKVSLDQVLDTAGMRIVVRNVDECYRTLGVVHNKFRPMLHQFKDYIAIPKANGYQSLHTTVKGFDGVPVEVQIRTLDMHRVAEAGIAAHWSYKANERIDAAPQSRARAWLQSLINLNSQEQTTKQFVENVKEDLFPGNIFVFSPKGKIIRLPKGGTPVDFAYAIHTDVGHKCTGALVDRNMAPLGQALENGQTVEIITDKSSQPNPAWLNFVVTTKARTSIRQYIRSITDDDAIELGKRMLDRALRLDDSSLKKIPRASVRQIADEYELETVRELFQQIGLGVRLAPIVASRLLGMQEGIEEIQQGGELPALTITGAEGMVVTYGKCCFPVPGDKIMGYLSTGRGIVVHREKCGNLVELRNQPARCLKVAWEQSEPQDFLVEVKFLTRNRPGVLAALSAKLADKNTNIVSVDVQHKDDDTSLLTFQFYVKDKVHLKQVIAATSEMENMLSVTRSL